MIDYFDKILRFAQNGFEFFPLKPGGSGASYYAPDKWNEMGTSNVNQLQEWEDSQIYQGYAMVFKNQKAICFDLDVNHVDGVNGVASFRDLAKEYGIKEPSIIIKTPSGGVHLIYKHPGFAIKGSVGYDFRLMKAKMNTGIDIRADKNFIASLGVFRNDKNHNNATYEIIKGGPDSELTELPQEIIDRFAKADEYKVPKSHADLMVDTVNGLCGFVDEVKNTPMFGEIPSRIEDGTRDDVLTSLAASWSKSGMSKSNMMVLMREAAGRCATPPDFNVEDKVESALNNPKVRYSSRSLDMEYLLKDLVFLTKDNKYMFLHDRSVMTWTSLDVVLGHITVEVEKPLTAKQQERVDNGEAVNRGSKFVPILKVFKYQPDKLIANTIGYKPGAEDLYFDSLANGLLANKYVKPDIKARQNDELFRKFEEFAAVICGDKEKGRILVEFIAFMVQKPAKKIGVCLVIITRQGSGKGFFLKVVKKVLGASNVFVADSGKIQSNFNSMLAHSQLVVVNEATGNQEGTAAGKRESRLFDARWKSMITDTEQAIEPKGVDISQQNTYGNFLVFSNDLAAVSFGSMERRHMCFVNDNPTETPETKKVLDSFDVLKTESGTQAIQYGLETMELKTIHEHMTHVAKTEDDKQVYRANLEENHKTIYDDIRNKRFIFTSDIISDKVFSWYCAYRFGSDMHKDSKYIKRLRNEFFSFLKWSDTYKSAKQVKNVKIDTFYVSYSNRDDDLKCGGAATHNLYVTKAGINEEQKTLADFDIKQLSSYIHKSVGQFKRELGLELSAVERPDYLKNVNEA